MIRELILVMMADIITYIMTENIFAKIYLKIKKYNQKFN